MNYPIDISYIHGKLVVNLVNQCSDPVMTVTLLVTNYLKMTMQQADNHSLFSTIEVTTSLSAGSLGLSPGSPSLEVLEVHRKSWWKSRKSSAEAVENVSDSSSVRVRLRFRKRRLYNESMMYLH